jgi:replication factor A2
MDFQGGGDGGGGYGGGSSQADPSSSQGRTRRPYDEQTLTPVTIRMVRRAHPDTAGGDGSLVLQDGRKLASVKIVGAVRSVEDHSTNVVYNIEDGTGLIEVKQWLDDNECTALQELRQETLKEHVYLKIVGQIKDYEGNKIIVANSVRPLSSGNELTHHMLEVAYSGERHKRGKGGGGGSDDPLRAAVLHLFEHHEDSGEAGVHVQVCVDKLSGSFQEAEIRKMIEALSEEGHIYSTVSDDHFQFAR